MSTEETQTLIKEQEKFFKSGKSKNVDFRLEKLRKLRKTLIELDEELNEAFRKDLGKHPFESYASEHGLVIQELGLMIRNLKKWARPQRVYTPMAHWFARSYYLYQPFGRVLIISPWNYPFQLLFMPLVGAVAAGNCVLAKPSRHAPHTTEIMKKIINMVFEPSHVSIVEGGSEINEFLLEQKFDYIFFTGSTGVGKKVMAAASRHLTPVSLELGGKSPVIVEPDVSPSLAAKRIMWGKLLNAGQSCVAPDYVLVHKDIKTKLIEELNVYTTAAYGTDIKSNPEYARIINESTAEKLAGWLKDQNIIFGGETDTSQKYIAPTLVEVDDQENILMNEEIFGPILPIVEYENLDTALEIIQGKSRPLALYIFTRSKKVQKRIILETQSGTGGINETVVHFVNPYLPFGGVGKSGIGRYHGRFSFETLSYKRSFLDKANWIDIPLRYPPYGKKLRLIRFFIR